MPASASRRMRRLEVRRPDEVELEVLARRHVAEAARAAGRDVGERAELRGAGDALRELHPQHVDAVLALAVRAARDAVGAPLRRRRSPPRSNRPSVSTNASISRSSAKLARADGVGVGAAGHAGSSQALSAAARAGARASACEAVSGARRPRR